MLATDTTTCPDQIKGITMMSRVMHFEHKFFNFIQASC